MARAKDQPRYYFITDIGSTTTKAILFQKDDRWGYRRMESPTTVERPYEDVTVGVRETFSGLGRETGLPLFENGRPSGVYLSTSSAGGGLAMVVNGLISHLTARSAERVALGAGAILLDIISLDDDRTPYQQIESLKALRPDMILLSGGFEGGALSGPVFLAEILSQAELHPKLNPKAQLPLIYAGNQEARKLVEKTLAGKYLYFNVPNIRPSDSVENLGPAREKIHELFIDHVMSHAPGYNQIVQWVQQPVIPTPAAVSRLLALVTRDSNQKIMVIDIGGATTDVFTAEKGKVFRTVSANLGMSYSILNVVRRAGIEPIKELLQFAISEEELFDRIGNKYLNPTALPGNLKDLRIEQAVGTIAIREAVKDHLTVLGGSSVTVARGKHKPGRNISDVFKPENSVSLFLDGYDLVIGSGGTLSHSPREVAAMMLLDALLPVGKIALAVDSAFMFPHLGVLAGLAPDLAQQLYEKLGLVKLATVLGVKGPAHPGELVLKLAPAEEKFDLPSQVTLGELIFIKPPRQGNFKVRLKSGVVKVMDGTIEIEDSLLGFIVDARGRPCKVKTTKLVHDHYSLPEPVIKLKEESRIYRGAITLPRELAIPGDVFVRVGQKVDPQTLVAKCKRAFLRPFFLNVAETLGIHPQDIREVLLKKEGDHIKNEEIIAREKTLFGKKFRSPVEGKLEKILSNGTIIVRETAEHAQEKYLVDTAKVLGIKAVYLKPYLKCQVGDVVDKGQLLASKMDVNEVKFCKSPVRGAVKAIDPKEGIITILPLLEELEVRAWLPGIVDKVSTLGCSVSNRGIILKGAWGNGGETAGELRFDDAQPGCILVAPNLSREMLYQLQEKNPAGLIMGSAHLRHFWKKQPPFTVVALEGFGNREINFEMLSILKQHQGKLALLDGTTQLRVGVRRPRIILPETLF
ncbi:glutamate mutase L [bacterium]|nr:glutamate mutase L [bacterium]